MSADGQSPRLYQPKPRRPFEYNGAPHPPPSPLLTPAHFENSLSRTHSIQNLTSSTLKGIYSTDGYETDRETEPPTPWGTDQFPLHSRPIDPPPIRKIRRKSVTPHISQSAIILSFGWRSTLLFVTGMGYGGLVRQLHDDEKLAPFQIEGIIKPIDNWTYLVLWGLAGIFLGNLLPYIDTLFCSETPLKTIIPPSVSTGLSPERAIQEQLNSDELVGTDWQPAIRSVGAFMGIAFAIRKLPWASSLQASLTLFLVNPVLWYLVDRSKPGFVLSSAVGATGTALLLASNPDMLPSPTRLGLGTNESLQNIFGDLDLIGISDYVSRESVEGGIWILSVLFCSCVCFGNVGRRLALSGSGPTKIQR
ncbi:hypothetical protein HYFRA_00011703 [Hymenoscyphus fraxineus]|uniref:Uncharacterized protein n=1 Tax=Hymenoscyphus fraxineus TaxID=746836 RepID=A0A9N9PJH6_9HELO|nr:hypothetical protein HYFRA_00011703 [Hymenoscyphus fraxineus]